jgi:hypothetical protein
MRIQEHLCKSSVDSCTGYVLLLLQLSSVQKSFEALITSTQSPVIKCIVEYNLLPTGYIRFV